MALFCNTLKTEPFQFFLSDEDLINNTKIAFSTYMDDFSEIIKNSVRDFKRHYLNEEVADDD
jgi:hypothetical protein